VAVRFSSWTVEPPPVTGTTGTFQICASLAETMCTPGKLDCTQRCSLHSRQQNLQEKAKRRRPRKIDTVFANYVRFFKLNRRKQEHGVPETRSLGLGGAGAGVCLHRVRWMYPFLCTYCRCGSIVRCTSGRAFYPPTVFGNLKLNSTRIVFLLSISSPICLLISLIPQL